MGAVNLLDRPLDDLIKPHGGGQLELDRDNPITRGLVGAWLINEGGGAKYYDLCGNADGTYALTTGTHPGRGEQGKYGEALIGSETGSSDGRINIGSITSSNPVSLSSGNTATIMMLAQFTAVATNDFPRSFEKASGASGANGYSLQGGNNGQRQAYFYIAGVQRSTSNSSYYIDGVPHIYTVVRNGLQFDWYRDLTLHRAHTSGYSANFPTATADAAIGNATFTTDREWAGPIWAMYVWDRALEYKEIVALNERPWQIVRDPARFDVRAFLAPAGGATVTFAGALAAVSALTGALAVKRAMSGAAPSVTTLAGVLVADRAIAGTLASVSAIAGDVAVARPVSGVVAGVSALVGDAVVLRGMSGAAVSISSLAGNIDVARALAGTLAAVSGLSGGIDIAGQVEVSGALAASSGLAGVLDVSRPIAGIVTTASGLAGAAAVTRGLAGSVVAVSGLSGALLVRRGLAGSLAAVSGLQGRIDRLAGLAGSLDAISAMTGALGIQGQVDPVTYQDTANAYANTRAIGAAGNSRVIDAEPTIGDS